MAKKYSPSLLFDNYVEGDEIMPVFAGQKCTVAINDNNDVTKTCTGADSSLTYFSEETSGTNSEGSFEMGSGTTTSADGEVDSW